MSKFGPKVSKLDPLKVPPILKPITFLKLSTTKSEQFLIGPKVTPRNQIWTIKLDFRKDQRILINNYLMTFKLFSTLSTEILDSKSSNLKISRICTYKTWNRKIANIATNFSVQKLENGLKVIRYIINQNSLIFPKI